ncbi:MAG: hypothetical protein EXR64_00605 [Dehalococcoidia bacterium]|nr:hypothetical protein [Dehalococcoidia bacterium]
MNDRRDLASIVDRCLDDLAAGRATLEACLARYPEHRAALAPLLTAAATMRVPRRAERAPDPARRAALMTEIRRTPQQRVPWWRHGLPTFNLGGMLPRLALGAAPVAAAVAISLVLLTTQTPTPADAASTLTLFAGSVEEQRGDQWQPVADGARLRAGVRLRTTAEGRALLTFPDGSTAALDTNTDVDLERIEVAPRVVVLRQRSGRLWNDVATDLRAGAAYEVRTDDATVQVHGTIFETSIDGGHTSVATAEGTVDVVAGPQRVSVPSGELVRAQRQQVAERSVVERDGSLTVDAPFAAALVGPGGEATGAKTSGALFQQIRGVTTSDPGAGPQRFDFQRVEPGEYTLLLRPYSAGVGTVVLQGGGPDRVERSITLDGGGGEVAVRVRVAEQNGKRSMELVEGQAKVAPRAADPVRVVETARTKPAEDLAAQRERAASVARERGTVPGIGAFTALTAPGAEQFARDLRAALAGADDAALRAQLEAIFATGVTAGDAAGTRQRMQVLAAFVAQDDAAARLARALVGDQHATLRAQLLRAGEGTLAPEVHARLRGAILGERLAARPTPPVTRPTQTPAARPTEVLSARPAQTPAVRPTERPAERREERDDARPTPTPPARPTIAPTRAATATAAPAELRAQRLRDALARNDANTIRAWLADLVAPANAGTAEVGLRTLASLTSNDDAANRVTKALAGDGEAALRNRVAQLSDAAAPAELRARLRRMLLGETPAPPPQIEPARPTPATPAPRQ